MIMGTIPQPIDAALCARVEGLQSTAEYLTVILEIIQSDVERMREASKRYDRASSFPLSEVGDWRQIQVLINLASDQVAIVGDVASAFEVACMKPAS